MYEGYEGDASRTSNRGSALRHRMVREQLARRGIEDARVLDAMRSVPRDAFVAPEMVEFAYDDAPLPIDEGQTISQPYIVAVMAEALATRPEDRVLDIGTGSGYAAAVLSRMVEQVFTVERHRSLAEAAQRCFDELGYDNIRVRVGDGTLGWEEEAPFDAIQVAAGGPDVPPALREQLAPGGRMVIPTGSQRSIQQLLRIRRSDDGEVFEKESLGAVRFVPLVGAGGWEEDAAHATVPNAGRGADILTTPVTVAGRIGRTAESFGSIADAELDGFLDRIGGSRLVLLGEATHGTSEFYRMRARITRELVERKGFEFVAVEADWPDAAALDAWVRHEDRSPVDTDRQPFTRFPTWMWANEEVRDFLGWLREHNQGIEADQRVGFHGLDLYSLHSSIHEVLTYLDEVDGETAAAARTRYGCLTPWQTDTAAYGRAVLTGRYRHCEEDVVAALQGLLERRIDFEEKSGPRRFLDAEQNARLVADAEHYYRIMYYGGRSSWNLRDQHMFDTLEALLGFYGPDSRGVVWEHNSHIGDASATEMGARGEHNVGQLARGSHGAGAYLVGFGTHEGTVAAAHDWGDPVEIMDVRPSLEESYEALSHESGVERFLLPLRADHTDRDLLRELRNERLQRAIGVIYRPATERASHYFHASLPRQFDEYVWFNRTEAVTPLEREAREDAVPDTFPFAL